jgi:Dyp-type peroxidase family
MINGHRVDQKDVQGNILCGYGNDFRYGLYLFVRIQGARAGRKWLRKLLPDVTTAEPWRPQHDKPLETLNVAFTHKGLKRLGLPRKLLDTFPEEFRAGMKHRAEFLGDTGASDPNDWERALRSPHAVVVVTTRYENLRSIREKALREQIDSYHGDLEIAHTERAGLLTHPHHDEVFAREHFGFADGFSQPAIRGNGGPDTRWGMGVPRRWGWWTALAPGEFVLGYAGEDKLLPQAPAAPIGDSGSFMVLRKLHQDVAAFRAYLRKTAEHQLERDPHRDEKLAETERVVAAKMIGRWYDGRSLMQSSEPLVSDKQLQKLRKKINRFRYLGYLWHKGDPDGFACPLGAHVRRANPRDALGWNGKLTKRHRIVRRSMPFGDPFDPDQDEDADRGLIFVCYQASIARQFEVIQSRWLKDGDAFWLGGERDALSMSTGMTLQGKTSPTYLAPTAQPFVTTRGGGYFFAPGLTALQAIASAYWR